MPDALAPDPFTAMAAQLTPKRAVSYIRVSTREQAQRGGSEEGFSLPAQREANKRKAQAMGALVVKEFADRGESARSANRPELQKMLAYLKEDGGIDYVIVHKLDRLARNRADDVEINRAFEEAGVRLVSTSENIDQTPGGMLLHGIMSSIAEFYSRNLANEVIKGMGEKARNGGTLGKAPLGYLNVRARDENGREIRTIALDEERAPLIRLAFTEYATGNWTVRQLAEHLNTLGLSFPPTPRRCAKPITATRLHEILRHPYYKGIVTFQGVEYAGKHEPLVDSQTWQTVQTILASRRYGERQRIHNHFLKSTVVCGQCGARLSVQNAKNSKGTIYPYFVCARRCRLHDCAFTAVLIDVVEDRMSDLYRAIELSAEDRAQIEHYLHDELSQIEGDKAKAVRSLTTRRTNIEDRRRRLLHAHYEGAVPLDLLKEEQAELSTELNQIERQLAAYQADAAEVRQHLTQALDLLEDCHRLYRAAPAHLKKLLNQVFFERVLVNPLVDEEGRVILPGDGTSDGANAGGPADTDAAGEETGGEDSAGEEGGTSDASGGGAADPDTPVLTSRPIHLADTGSGTRLSALLTPPFDQLASPSLHAAAHTHHLQHAAQLDNSTTPPAAGGTPMSSTIRTTPTLVGERCSTSGTASQPVSTGEGLDKSWLVPPAGLEPARP
ncbi:recombinase family protein [Actinomyces oris]|uniref:Recombinase family protein n=1 Tax=Actinomyces oris TaxID=544580 RepID=A0AAW9KY13_9ACTO|nr:recombinase family protein [Actinomyces oris]MEA1304464.1 recombinase family protein [Actinomyces oris]